MDREVTGIGCLVSNGVICCSDGMFVVEPVVRPGMRIS
jgi:hypothetical protein